MENATLKKYYEEFGEFPFLLTTTTYDDLYYIVLMENAIIRGTPLTVEEIEKAFKNNYDVVIEEKTFKNFKKGTH